MTKCNDDVNRGRIKSMNIAVNTAGITLIMTILISTILFFTGTLNLLGWLYFPAFVGVITTVFIECMAHKRSRVQ